MKGRWGERFARRVLDDIHKPAAGNRSSLSNWLTTIFSGSRDHTKVAQSREFRQIARAGQHQVLSSHDQGLCLRSSTGRLPGLTALGEVVAQVIDSEQKAGGNQTAGSDLR